MPCPLTVRLKFCDRPRRLKPSKFGSCCGTAEAVPFPESLRFRSAGTGWFPIHKQDQSQKPRARVPAPHGQLHPLVLPQLMHL